MPADPKRRPRIVNPHAGRVKLAREGRCRICGRVPSGSHLDSLNRMHVVAKGGAWLGDDIEDNIVPGCGSGTTGCHGLLTSGREDPNHPTGMTVAEARSRMNERLTPEEYEYAESRTYVGWVDDVYPRIERSVAV